MSTASAIPAQPPSYCSFSLETLGGYDALRSNAAFRSLYSRRPPACSLPFHPCCEEVVAPPLPSSASSQSSAGRPDPTCSGVHSPPSSLSADSSTAPTRPQALEPDVRAFCDCKVKSWKLPHNPTTLGKRSSRAGQPQVIFPQPSSSRLLHKAADPTDRWLTAPPQKPELKPKANSAMVAGFRLQDS